MLDPHLTSDGPAEVRIVPIRKPSSFSRRPSTQTCLSLQIWVEFTNRGEVVHSDSCHNTSPPSMRAQVRALMMVGDSTRKLLIGQFISANWWTTILHSVLRETLRNFATLCEPVSLHIGRPFVPIPLSSHMIE